MSPEHFVDSVLVSMHISSPPNPHFMRHDESYMSISEMNCTKNGHLLKWDQFKIIRGILAKKYSNAEVIDKGRTSCALAGFIFYGLNYIAGLGCLYSYTFRSKLRGLYSLPEEPCMDFCVHCFCAYCAICQEYRELKNRGLDPSIGWTGNEEKTNRANQVPPNVAPGMTR
ncbi:PLANT CADMIUM RESISTANCE 12 [Spatholobus suberectus]|nr:PLANT CADMIUM RESISTANCE 12 [Spatholobus suberectus]